MEKLEQLYEGKAKKVFATSDPNLVIVDYKDDATALDGAKKGTIVGKGVINNKMSNFMMQKLEKAGVPTHFVEQLSDRETVVKKVSIVPLEVIIRNIAAGSFSKRYGVPEGTELKISTIEFSYKNDDPPRPADQRLPRDCFGPRDPRRDRTDQGLRLQGQRHDAGIPPDPRDHPRRFQAGVRQDRRRPDRPRRRNQPRHLPLQGRQDHAHLDKDLFRRDLGGAEEATRRLCAA